MQTTPQAFEDRYGQAREELFVGLSRNADPASILQGSKIALVFNND